MTEDDFRRIIESAISHTQALLRDGSTTVAAAADGLGRISENLRELSAPKDALKKLDAFRNELNERRHEPKNLGSGASAAQGDRGSARDLA